MKFPNLRKTVRDAVLEIEKAGPAVASVQSGYVRMALHERGLGPGCHVGNKNMTEEETIEWYAGQLLNIVDEQTWVAMNSYINCLDRFCPEKPESE